MTDKRFVLNKMERLEEKLDEMKDVFEEKTVLNKEDKNKREDNVIRFERKQP